MYLVCGCVEEWKKFEFKKKKSWQSSDLNKNLSDHNRSPLFESSPSYHRNPLHTGWCPVALLILATSAGAWETKPVFLKWQHSWELLKLAGLEHTCPLPSAAFVFGGWWWGGSGHHFGCCKLHIKGYGVVVWSSHGDCTIQWEKI